MKRKSYCVYIMGSLSGTLYIGVTGNLQKRAFEHKFHRLEGFTHKYDVERLTQPLRQESTTKRN